MESTKPYDPDLSAIEALKYFRVIFKSMTQHFHEIEQIAGIGGASLWVLSEISCNDRLTVNGLAKAMAIHQSTASNLLEKLEKSGLITRNRSTEDKRVVYLELTSQGNEILKKAPLPHKGILPDALSKLSQDNLETLIRILAELTEKIDSKQESRAFEPLGKI